MTDLLRGVNVFLIGMMGSGKSTIGKRLAEQLNYRFFDTDAVIEKSAQRSINDIFSTDGETAFRALETEVLSQLSTYVRLAIATGGGIILERKNWSYLRHGIVIWLDTPVDVLYNRLKNDVSRPLLQSPDPRKTLEVILNQRYPLYAQADLKVTVQANETPAQLVDRILETLPTILKEPSQTPPSIE
ncbi:MAG: shikimate kinase [Cyanobacteria bacterium J06633_2]